MIELSNKNISAIIDPKRGSDILSLVEKRSGIDVLFKTPWRARADAIRNGQPRVFSDPWAGWLEQYRGGWQTLSPNGGDPRHVHLAPVAFHGEASVVAWTVEASTKNSVDLSVEMFSVPVRIERNITLNGTTISVVDTLTNLSSTALEIDYAHHPAFGGPFLEGNCRIETGARRFTSDVSTMSVEKPGSEYQWPLAISSDGEPLDLRQIPTAGSERELFGWLHDFSEHWASITNLDLGLAVDLKWDGTHLPYAWFWQELNASDEFPWYKRARVIAIEPSSMQTGGSSRRSVLQLGPEGRCSISISISLRQTSIDQSIANAPTIFGATKSSEKQNG
jgi:Domain of unknown function (DUF4432)